MNKLIITVITVLTLTACGTTGVPGGAIEVPDQASVSDYQIGVGDQLSVNVWKNPELSLAVPVRPDGKISLPLIGDIAAAGMTTSTLSKNITTGLKTYLRSPQVTVIVLNAGSSDFQLRVRVTGAVNNPQSLAHREGMTVLDLVLQAGGPNEFAAPNRAKLYRKIGDEVKVYPVRLGDILTKGKLDTNYALYPSDIVTIPERLF